MCRSANRRVANDVVREKDRDIHDTYQDVWEIEVPPEEFYTIKLKVFIFHNVLSVIIAKLKTKANQRAEMCEFEMVTSSDGNLIPIRTFKALFPNRTYRSKFYKLARKPDENVEEWMGRHIVCHRM